MSLLSEILIPIGSAIIGAIGTYFTKITLDKRGYERKRMEKQLKNFYAPMESLLKINEQAYQKYFSNQISSEDRIEIENETWIPNFDKILDLIKNQSNHIPELSEEILDLVTHIIIWKTEHNRIRTVEKDTKSPVTGWMKNTPFPKTVNTHIENKANELRSKLNIE